MTKRFYQDNPPRYEYLLTEMGRDFFPVLASMLAGEDKWLDDGGGAPVTLQHRQPGKVILALANWPRVDSNSPMSSPATAWEDMAVGYSYEPGSTFKAFTVSGAVQDGLVTPNTEFNVPSELQVADRTIHDAESHGDETLSVAPDSQGVQQHRRGRDRGQAGRQALRLLGPSLRLRPAHRG